MKRLWLMVVFAVTGLAVPTGIRTVYILPMAGGLDQYLAEWLTRDHVVEVVADPKAADAVITDSLGEAFEQRMAQIRPPESADKAKTDSNLHLFRSGRVKGTIFLVDARTKTVLWSDFEKTPNSSSNIQLDREARRIARKLAGPTSKSTAQ